MKILASECSTNGRYSRGGIACGQLSWGTCQSSLWGEDEPDSKGRRGWAVLYVLIYCLWSSLLSARAVLCVCVYAHVRISI